MKLILKDTYASLQPFETQQLPNFVVISGVNGSGKTQLLNAILKVVCTFEDDLGIPWAPRLQLNELQLQNIQPAIFSSTQNEKALRQAYPEKEGIAFPLIQILITENLLDKINDHDRTSLLSYDSRYENLLNIIWQYGWNTVDGVSEIGNLEKEKKILDRYLTGENIARALNRIEVAAFDFKKRTRFEKMEKDIYGTITSNSDIFNFQIENLFRTYLSRRFWNLFYFISKPDFGKNNLYVSDEQFLAENTPPWEIINNVLHENHLDFEFQNLELTDFDPEGAVPIFLRKTSNNSFIQSENLSSGEKMILGLILKLFLVDNYNGQISYPEIILLDEPDAYLHPQMTKLMIDVLQNSFVEKLNIRIFLTTHSPTTVALVPEGSLFEMKNGTQTSLTSVEKDYALKILTGFLPTLSIDYKNHRQVFVESPNDIKYYQSLYEIHNRSLNKKLVHQLYFIPSGGSKSGKGNCAQVYEIVKNLRNSGNTTSFGIVDQDKGNLETDNVFVHGLGERYSIESFLFDPIYVFIYLFQKGFRNLNKDLDLLESYSFHNIGLETNERLQEFVKYFFTVFSEKNYAYRNIDETVTIEYLNGKHVKVPKKYMDEQGHDGLLPKLNKAFGDIFPERDGVPFAGELKDWFATTIASCYPFVPKSSIDLIERLTNN